MKEILGRIVAAELEERRKQGYDVEALRPLLGKASGSCDALLALSQRIKEAPIRQDWPYEEPDDLESVMAACDPTRRREASRLLSDEEIEALISEQKTTQVTLKVGDMVDIVDGVFADYSGRLDEISPDGDEVTVIVSSLGRDMPIKLEMKQIRKKAD